MYAELMKRLGLIDFPAFNFATARKVAPLSFVFIAYVVVSLISLGRVNVPMFTALRRLTIVFVMIEEYFLLSESSLTEVGIPFIIKLGIPDFIFTRVFRHLHQASFRAWQS